MRRQPTHAAISSDGQQQQQQQKSDHVYMEGASGQICLDDQSESLGGPAGRHLGIDVQLLQVEALQRELLLTAAVQAHRTASRHAFQCHEVVEPVAAGSEPHCVS